MERTSIPLKLIFEGKFFHGWAIPSIRRHNNGHDNNYHVVLNEAYFGDMSLDGDTWSISHPQPAQLVAAVGKLLEHALASVM